MVIDTAKEFSTLISKQNDFTIQDQKFLEKILFEHPFVTLVYEKYLTVCDDLQVKTSFYIETLAKLESWRSIENPIQKAILHKNKNTKEEQIKAFLLKKVSYRSPRDFNTNN